MFPSDLPPLPRVHPTLCCPQLLIIALDWRSSLSSRDSLTEVLLYGFKELLVWICTKAQNGIFKLDWRRMLGRLSKLCSSLSLILPRADLLEIFWWTVSRMGLTSGVSDRELWKLTSSDTKHHPVLFCWVEMNTFYLKNFSLGWKDRGVQSVTL